jgi:hypothetical protein
MFESDIVNTSAATRAGQLFPIVPVMISAQDGFAANCSESRQDFRAVPEYRTKLLTSSATVKSKLLTSFATVKSKLLTSSATVATKLLTSSATVTTKLLTSSATV